MCRCLLFSLALLSTSLPEEAWFLVLQYGLPLQHHVLLGRLCFLGVLECRADVARLCVFQGPVSGGLGEVGRRLGRPGGSKLRPFLPWPERTPLADVLGSPWTLVSVQYPSSSCHPSFWR